MRVEVGEGMPMGYLPPAYRYLREVPSVTASGKALRPALGIYNVSLNRLVRAMVKSYEMLANQIEERRIPKGNEGLGWMYPTVESWVELLHAADAHIDDVRLIAMSVLGGSSSWKTTQGKRFTARTKPYRERVSRIVNHIKHSHGRLRPFAFYTASACYPGYYVEGVHRSGALGPEPTVHRGGKGAFSFARDSRLHLAWLFLLSSELALLLDSCGIATTDSVSVLAGSSKFIEIAEAVQQVPFAVFPDERTQSVPRVEFADCEGMRRLELSYVDDASAKTIPRSKQLRIATIWQGDGTSSSFVLPYEYTAGPENSLVLTGNS